MTGVNTQLDVQLDGLIELGGSTLHNQLQSFGGIILNGAVNQLGALLILFASKQCFILLIVVMRKNPPTFPVSKYYRTSNNQSTTVTPMERQVPAT